MEKTNIIQFSIGSEDYGFIINQVVEVERYVQLSRVPRMPNFVEGYLNLRGRILIVLDLRRQLGLRASKPNSESRIIIAKVAGELLGFIVDYVDDIKEIQASEIQSPGEFALKISENFVSGVVVQDKGLIIILNLESLMFESEREALRRLHSEFKEKSKKSSRM